LAAIPLQPVQRERSRHVRLRWPSLGKSPQARREAKWGILFISPWIIGFLAFTLIPIVASLGISFSNLSLAQEQPLRFVGLDNYATMLGDRQVWESLGITLRFAALNLPIAIIIPFVVALVLSSPYLRAKGVFRTLFFLPYVIPFVAGVLAWQGMLNIETGWIASVLRFVGIEPPNFLEDPTFVYPSLVFIGLWAIGAGVIVNLAGLRAVPTELYDAVHIDGGGWWPALRHVTLPLMSPVIFYALVLGIVEVLQYFLVPLVLYNGSGQPGGSTLFFNLLLYKTAFGYQNFAYGSALAWLLFGVTLVITLLVFRSARYWVYAAGER
jgi:multiple sugar transport system permease protein